MCGCVCVCSSKVCTPIMRHVKAAAAALIIQKSTLLNSNSMRARTAFCLIILLVSSKVHQSNTAQVQGLNKQNICARFDCLRTPRYSKSLSHVTHEKGKKIFVYSIFHFRASMLATKFIRIHYSALTDTYMWFAGRLLPYQFATPI